MPQEFYNMEYAINQSETTKNTYNTLRKLTLTRAEHDNYILRSEFDFQTSPIPLQYPSLFEEITTPIPEERKTQLLEQMKVITNSLPDYKSALKNENLTPDDIVRFPIITDIVISPTSKTLK